MATVVAFHAHPDDEVLLTGGTLARLAAEGHRVVIVVATDGIMGPATRPGTRDRLAELRASAAHLGAARVAHLGYADSGHGPVLYPDPPDRPRFVRADPGEAAAKLAALIKDEGADLLLSYDPQGGYGHRDHVRVHEVGARAAAITGIRVMEATLPRELVIRALSPVRVPRLVVRHDRRAISAGFTPGPRSRTGLTCGASRRRSRPLSPLISPTRAGGAGLRGCAGSCSRCRRPSSACCSGASGTPSPAHRPARPGEAAADHGQDRAIPAQSFPWFLAARMIWVTM